MRTAVIAALMFAACADAGTGLDGVTTSEAPLVGVDGGHDQADRNCNVVLRGLERNWTGFTWESVHTAAGSDAWVWQGTIDISEGAAAEGLEPSVLYRMGSSQSWTSAHATPTGQPAAPGYVQYSIRLSEGLPGPGWSGTAIYTARIEVAPYLELREGGRLFDHNRHAGDFDNYVVNQPDYAVWADANACIPPQVPQRATLTFAADWSEKRAGVIVPGGSLAIAFDEARLAQCHYTSGGHALYDISAHVVFGTGVGNAPIERVASVRDAVAIIAVPPVASDVSIYFETTNASGCHAYDSNLGANYAFAVAHPPQWTGNVGNLIVRDSGDACDGQASASAPFSFDTWARQRAVKTNLCFQVYQPGLTDHDDADLWQKLDVAVKWRVAGEATWHTTAVDFDKRVGNNARYAFSWRTIDPLRSYQCPPVAPTPNADGQTASLSVEYFLVVNGGEVRPQPGAAFVGTFSDYLHDPWRDANCH